MKIFRFFLIWYSQNMAIPFWVVGHVHLTMNTYEDWQEYGVSALMHAAVLIGFILDYKQQTK